MIRGAFLTASGLGLLAAATSASAMAAQRYVVDGSDVSMLSDEYLDMLA